VSRIVAIGERELVDGYGLAGVEIRPAGDAASVERAFAEVEDDAGLLLLTPAAEAALRTRLAETDRLVWVVLPA
jgi:vacuolar-type H+-ATPase subunit F/Vma7